MVLLSSQAFPANASLDQLLANPGIEALSYTEGTQDRYRFLTESKARYVRVQLRGSTSLHMAEVVVNGCSTVDDSEEEPQEEAPEEEDPSDPPITPEERNPTTGGPSQSLQELLDCSRETSASIAPLNPSKGQNYIRSTYYRSATTGRASEENKVQTITYYDGLGRPIQAIEGQATPKGKDLISYMQYDGFGRQARSYLPFSLEVTLGSAPGAFRKITNPELATENFYKGLPSLGDNQTGLMPWADTEFEPSPLNRVVEQGAPGADWQPEAAPGQQGSGEHTRVMKYHSNSQSVPGFDPKTLNSTSIPVKANFFPKNSLTILRTYDENGALTETATDKLGRTIYNSVQVGKSYRISPIQSDSFATTYFVYDLHSNVRYVIQPEGWKQARSRGLSSTLLRNYCFQYEYDERQRIRRKRVPGSDWVDLVYDELDRVVATQDGMLRQKKQWLVTKYDYLGRPIKTGISKGIENRAELEELISYNLRPYESLDDSKKDYSSYLDPQIDEVHSITFYDEYSFLPDNSFALFSLKAGYPFLLLPPTRRFPTKKHPTPRVE